MWMQTVNRTDVERVWVNVINAEGATMTAHWPVFKIMATANVASVSTNEAAISFANHVGTTLSLPNNIIGLAYEDIAAGEQSGVVQVYGYHESVLIANDGAALSTIRPGTLIGPMALVSVTLGLNSVGYAAAAGVIILDTITAVMMSAAGGRTYGNHVFLRCL